MTRRLPFIVLAGALLLTAAWWFLLYKPRVDQLATARAETRQLQSQSATLQGQIASRNEVKQNAAVYQSQLTRLVEYIPDDPAQPEALRELQRIADQSGVEIIEMTYADPEVVPGAPDTGDPETTLAKIPLQMTVDGGYFQIVDVLRRVEVDLNRAVKFDTVSMVESEDEFPQLAVTATGNIFAVLPLDEVTGEDGQVLVPEQPSEAASEGATEAPATDDEQTTENAPAAAPGDAQAGTS